MQSIDTAFRYIRGFSLVFIGGCTVITLYIISKSLHAIEKANQTIYILANGKALEAYAADRKDNIPVEIKDHVKTFHHYFFSLDPDDKVILGNTKKALYLADASAKHQYDNLRENGYYNDIIAGNISQQIEIDSIGVDIDQYPYYFRCRAFQKITRPTSIVTRLLITEGYLRNVARSDNNPHGFLIEKWKTLENRDTEFIKR